jgi:4-hydroxy-tetrahydrodipicolinate reductase
MKILVTGANGRMGQTVAACCEADPEVEIGAQIDVGDDLPAALAKCDAVVDFSFHTFTEELLAACVDQEKLLVIGTTGQSDEILAKVETAAETLPLVMAPNYSIGVNTLFWLTRKTADILGSDFDLEVIEMHHRMKVDAPSGTAKRLAEILADARELSYKEDMRHGREGLVGARTKDEIGVHSMRGGDVVGDHTVVYANVGERVELTHKASSRETFANGAIRAAKWLATQKAGRIYDMQDVLGLR